IADNALAGTGPRMRTNVVDAFYGDRRANSLRVGGSVDWRGFFRPLEEESEERGLPRPPELAPPAVRERAALSADRAGRLPADPHDVPLQSIARAGIPTATGVSAE